MIDPTISYDEQLRRRADTIATACVHAGEAPSADGSLDPPIVMSSAFAFESAEQASRAANQVSLFADFDESVSAVASVDVPRWDDRERLQNEKLALGYYLRRTSLSYTMLDEQSSPGGSWQRASAAAMGRTAGSPSVPRRPTRTGASTSSGAR